MLLPFGVNRSDVTGRNIVKEERVLSSDDEKLMGTIYSKIDRGLLFSFIGGVFLGITPYVYSGSWKHTSALFILLSLIMFFTARYTGLKFLFFNKENSEGEE